MSHEVETMAYANKVPWHGLGNPVNDDLTPEEMCVAAGIDWKVNLKQLSINVGTEEKPVMEKVAGRFALTRDSDNRVFTITGSSWHPLQNSEALGFMRDYVAAGGATLETAGSLRDGRVIWGLAKLNHNFYVKRGDRVEGYLLITSPHEVGKCITIRTTTVRVVCANTMALANSRSDLNYKQNHLSEFDVEAAKAHVAEAHEFLAQAEARAKTLSKLKINIEDAVRQVLVPALHPALLDDEDFMQDIMQIDHQPKSLQEVINSINNAPGAVPGTGWGVLNGVTHWADHVAGRDSGSRMWRSWMGDLSRAKVNVEETLFDMAQ